MKLPSLQSIPGLSALSRESEAGDMAGGKHVAVLMGGWSNERPVSLSSGRECAQALRNAGYEVTEVDVGRDVAHVLTGLKPDAVFNALHGPFGESGMIQGLLELLQIPYTHSGVLASALAMDKHQAKIVMKAAGIPVTDHVLAERGEIARAHVMPPPYVIKPIADGSSFGVFIVKADQSHPPQEIEGGSRHVVPAEIQPKIYDKVQKMALKAHAALGCRGVTRTDFRYNDRAGEDGELVCLEINTQPGMTPTSLAPEQARHAGHSFEELVSWMVEDASCNR
jgi:D-alanine-D-alanine ligase